MIAVVLGAVLFGAAWPSEAALADFKARINATNLAIQTSNFPKSSAYYVKVGPAESAAVQKIAMFNTRSGGSLSFNFLLPEMLAKASQETVCLKNNVTDANICRTTER